MWKIATRLTKHDPKRNKGTPNKYIPGYGLENLPPVPPNLKPILKGVGIFGTIAAVTYLMHGGTEEEGPKLPVEKQQPPPTTTPQPAPAPSGITANGNSTPYVNYGTYYGSSNQSQSISSSTTSSSGLSSASTPYSNYNLYYNHDD